MNRAIIASDEQDIEMQKTDFVKAVAEKAKISQKDTKEVIDAALEVIADQLKAGNKVTLTGFGTF